MKFTGMHDFMHCMIFFFFVFHHPSSTGLPSFSHVVLCSSHAHVHRQLLVNLSVLGRKKKKRLIALLCTMSVSLIFSSSCFVFSTRRIKYHSIRMHYLIQPLPAVGFKRVCVCVAVIWDITTYLRTLNVLLCSVHVPVSVWVYVHISERERELKGGTACTEGFQSWPSFLGQSLAEFSSQSWLIVDETVVGESLNVFP